LTAIDKIDFNKILRASAHTSIKPLSYKGFEDINLITTSIAIFKFKLNIGYKSVENISQFLTADT
jgi:hypothetical protein